MSIWQELGASVGIGACKLSVTLDTPAAGWGETISGRVEIRGGEVSQKVGALNATIVEHWVTVVSTGKSTIVVPHHRYHDSRNLGTNLVAAPGDQLAFEFTLQMPWGADFGHGWCVACGATIAGAVDPAAKCDFRPLPPPVFAELAEELHQAGRMPVVSWHLLPGAGARATLKPDDATREILDGLTLDLYREAEVLRGQVVVNPQEHSLGDVLQSLVRADRRSTPFEFPSGDVEAARAVFEEALRPNLDALRQLPIPASAAPAAPGELPRPSSPAEESRA